ncbi:hypothetical protein B9Z19DRAFT_1121935 [Tuber borchii]|uniref:Uncharacterized protein n=1 Tax=Tuber borchii TaxID=42251 RepID=A0A2T7A1M2_TUBBO|nr:hypothetical protein B9Z19DRAFT_1121935 [Tuber borchii]
MHLLNPQTPIKTAIPITPSTPRRMRTPNLEFPESPSPDTSRAGSPFGQQARNETPQNLHSPSSLTWDQSIYNTALTPSPISNLTPMSISPKYYPGSPRQLLPPSGIPTISEVRHPPLCTPNFEEACKTIHALDNLLEEVRLLKADTFFSNPYWSELNIFFKDFQIFLNQESDSFFIFAGGASVATDADSEGLGAVAQTIFDTWSVIKEAILRNNPGEGIEDEDAMVID